MDDLILLHKEIFHFNASGLTKYIEVTFIHNFLSNEVKLLTFNLLTIGKANEMHQ